MKPGPEEFPEVVIDSRGSALKSSLLLATLLVGCFDVAPAVPLEELVLQDSVYLDAQTLVPYTGSVVKSFAGDPGKVQLRGELAEGTWNGDIVVYHSNGRIRYEGTLSRGQKCGAWVENRDPEPPADVFAELKQEIESMGLYPPCPEG